MKINVCLCCILLFWHSAFAATVEIKYVDNTAHSVDYLNNYYVSLLHLALQSTSTDYVTNSVDIPMSHKRVLKSLSDGEIDVMWTMTSINMENQALPIRIPLLKGLLGYRVFVIRKQSQSYFTANMALDNIKSLVAVQGKDWVDADILKMNGFNVENTSWMNTIYKTLNAGHFDYFPRSIIEANTEFKRYDTQDLTIEKNILLHYPTAVYFFVRKNDHQLAKTMEAGLRLAIENGQLDKLLFEHPDHKEALAKSNIHKRSLYRIPNPLLPSQTPTDPKLWIDISSL